MYNGQSKVKRPLILMPIVLQYYEWDNDTGGIKKKVQIGDKFILIKI